MPARLLALGGGSDVLLDKPVLLIGRSPECDVCLPSARVSRRHCCIAEAGDGLVVRDLGSTNGTRVNGNPVREGRLRVGDELMIGDRRFRVGPDVAGVRAKPAPSPPGDRKKTVLADEELEACEEPVALEEPAPPMTFPFSSLGL